jgi:DNA-binding transcriptional LysR family regulator
MVPTERASRLEAPIREALAGLEKAFLAPGAFSPARSTRRFRIASADYCEFVVLPELCARITQEAPGVALDVTPLPGGLPAEELRAGRYDLAIGNFSQIPQGCLMRDLFREDFACIARKGHPRIRKRLTLAAFTEVGHVLIAPSGRAGSMVDDVLARRGLQRHVAISTPHFLVPPSIVASSDLISTLARRVANHYAKHYPLRVFKPPLEIPSFPIVMVWHRRCDGAPDQRWLRDRIAQASMK